MARVCNACRGRTSFEIDKLIVYATGIETSAASPWCLHYDPGLQMAYVEFVSEDIELACKEGFASWRDYHLTSRPPALEFQRQHSYLRISCAACHALQTRAIAGIVTNEKGIHLYCGCLRFVCILHGSEDKPRNDVWHFHRIRYQPYHRFYLYAQLEK